MSNEIAVVSTPSQQQVATQPSRSLASRMFPNSGHKDVEAPAKSAATPAQVAEWRATIAASEARDRAECAARLPAGAVEDGQKMFAAFATPSLKQWVQENGLQSPLHVMDFLARAWRHLSAVERERDQLQREVAALKQGKR